MSESEECVICGGRVRDALVSLAGQEWPVCDGCSGLLGRATQLGAFPASGQCLHLAAGECEALAEGRARRALSGGEWRYRRIFRRSRDGTLRRLCPCATCQAVRDGDFRRTEPAVKAVKDGPLNVDGLPPVVLRALPPQTLVVTDLDGLEHVGGFVQVADVLRRVEARNIEETARPRLVPNGLAALSASVVVKPSRGFAAEVADDLSRAYWADVSGGGDLDGAALRHLARLRPFLNSFPQLHPAVGYFEGPYWVDRFGECHLLPEGDI